LSIPCARPATARRLTAETQRPQRTAFWGSPPPPHGGNGTASHHEDHKDHKERHTMGPPPRHGNGARPSSTKNTKNVTSGYRSAGATARRLHHKEHKEHSERLTMGPPPPTTATAQGSHPLRARRTAIPPRRITENALLEGRPAPPRRRHGILTRRSLRTRRTAFSGSLPLATPTARRSYTRGTRITEGGLLGWRGLRSWELDVGRWEFDVRRGAASPRHNNGTASSHGGTKRTENGRRGAAPSPARAWSKGAAEQSPQGMGCR
jgi:hypothetical protein